MDSSNGASLFMHSGTDYEGTAVRPDNALSNSIASLKLSLSAQADLQGKWQQPLTEPKW